MNYIYNDNLYRIICKKGNNAFVEKIKAYRAATKEEIKKLYLLGNKPGYYIDLRDSIATCSVNDIITGDINIIGTLVKNRVYHIQL